MKFFRTARRRVLALCAGLVVVACLGFLLAWLFPQQILCVDSGPVRGDLIVVLGSGASERPVRAAELFLEGVAPRILVTGQGDSHYYRDILLRRGVPRAAIQLEQASRSTYENAKYTVAMLRGAGQRSDAAAANPAPQTNASSVNTTPPARVILVTSWYHSRRTLKTFQHAAPDITFYSRPSYYAYSRSDWEREGVKKYIWKEYPKLLGYWLVHGVCPF